MAGNVKGIQIDIGGNTTGLSKALNSVKKETNSIQKELKDVDRLLKLDPKNTELLAQKQELLSKQIGTTKDKLQTLQAAKEKADADMVDGLEVNQEQYRLLQREIAKTEEELKSLEKEAEQSNSTLAKVSEATEKIGEKSESLGKRLLPVTATISGIGAAGVTAFKELDAGYDIIITKTGATGDALEELKASMNNIYGEIPTTAENAGIAVGEVNTRFGVTGEVLEQLSGQFIKFAQINDTDLNNSIGTTNKIMQAWNIDASETANVLGLITKKAQDTGISVDVLMNSALENNSTFKEMGLTFEESIGLMAEFEKNGVNSSTALAGLKKAAINYSKEGLTMEEGLKKTIDSIKNAATETEALSIAQETFGTKGAAEMSKAIREGRLSVNDLCSSMDEYGTTVEDTFNATLDPVDKANIAFNNLKIAGAELGKTLLASLAPIIEKTVEKVKSFAQWFSNLSDISKTIITVIMAIVASLGPALIIFGKICTSISTITKVMQTFSAITKVVTAAQWLLNVAMSANPIGIIIALVVALVAAFVVLWNKSEAFRGFWIKLWEVIKNAAQAAWEAVKKFFTTAWDNIQAVWGGAVEFFSKVWTDTKNVFSVVKDVLSGFFKSAWEAIKAVWSTVISYFASIWNGIKGVFSAAKTVLSAFFNDAWNAIKVVWSTAKAFFTTVWNNIKAIFSVVKSVLTGDFSGAWEGIKSIWSNTREFFSRVWENIKSCFKASELIQVGRNMLEGLWNGINDKVAWLKGKVKGVVDKIKSWFTGKDGFDVHSPSRYMRYKIGQMIGEGLALGIKDSSASVSEEFSKMLDDLNLQRDTIIEDDREYYKRLEELRDKYLETGTKDWWQYTIEIINYEESLIEAAKNKTISVYDDIAEAASNKLNDIKNKEESFANKLLDGRNLIERRTLQLSAGDVEGMRLTDWTKDIEAISSYNDALIKTSERVKTVFGDDTEAFNKFMELVRDGSVKESMQLTGLILSASDSELVNYINGWKELQGLIRSTSSNIYADEVHAIQVDFLDSLSEMLDTLPEEFKSCGETAAEFFGDSFIEKIQNVLSNIQLTIQSTLKDITIDMLPNTIQEYKTSIHNSKSNTFNITNNGGGTAASNALATKKTINSLNLLGVL